MSPVREDAGPATRRGAPLDHCVVRRRARVFARLGMAPTCTSKGIVHAFLLTAPPALQTSRDFEIHAVFGPLASKKEAVRAVNAVVQWVRAKDSQLFITSPAVY